MSYSLYTMKGFKPTCALSTTHSSKVLISPSIKRVKLLSLTLTIGCRTKKVNAGNRLTFLPTRKSPI